MEETNTPELVSVVDIQFRPGQKVYFFDPDGITLAQGDHVIIDTARGEEYGVCASGIHRIRQKDVVAPLRKVLRRASAQDERVVAENRAREAKAQSVCIQKIQAHGLDMQLVSAECAFDGSKILFYFTADERVDFRELVKDLAGVFHTRIELRQIGVRDKAKMVGGLGICGRPFCCASFLDDFQPVSIKMAKTQNLSLNPTKISGTCGRLMCCLKYEQEAYEDALKRLPKNDSFVQTPDGPGNVSDVNVLKETVKVRLDEKPEAPRCYHNCEVCVLRNGKGSREGIEIPKERPARYAEERQEEFPVPAIIADFAADREEPEEGRRRSRRRRGGKGSERPAERPAEKLAEKPEEKRREGNRRRRTRSGKPGASAIKPFPPQPDAKPVSRQESQRPIEDEGPSNKRPRHRGGRRRGGQGGGTPKTEA